MVQFLRVVFKWKKILPSPLDEISASPSQGYSPFAGTHLHMAGEMHNYKSEVSWPRTQCPASQGSNLDPDEGISPKRFVRS